MCRKKSVHSSLQKCNEKTKSVPFGVHIGTTRNGEKRDVSQPFFYFRPLYIRPSSAPHSSMTTFFATLDSGLRSLHPLPFLFSPNRPMQSFFLTIHIIAHRFILTVLSNARPVYLLFPTCNSERASEKTKNPLPPCPCV